MEKYSDEGEKEYLELKEYDRISEKILIKNKLPLTEENISFINHYMILSDYRFKEEVGCSREQFRGLYATYARKTISRKLLRNSKKGVEYSLDYDILKSFSDRSTSLLDLFTCPKQRKPVNLLIEKEFLDEIDKLETIDKTEKDCLKQWLTTNDTDADIGRDNNLAKKQIYFKLEKTKKKAAKELGLTND